MSDNIETNFTIGPSFNGEYFIEYDVYINDKRQTPSQLIQGLSIVQIEELRDTLSKVLERVT